MGFPLQPNQPPLTAAQVAKQHKLYSEISANQAVTAWIHHLPVEGRTQIIARFTDQNIQYLSYPYSVRSKVYEYGGGAIAAANDGVYFVNESDQQVYLLSAKGEVTPVTNHHQYRFGDLYFHASQQQLFAVAEAGANSQEATSYLVRLQDGKVQVVHQGRDFYANPRLSDDGKKLCYLAWDHPYMPWDAAELWCSEFGAEWQLLADEHVAGNADEAICQPEFIANEKLLFLSDRSGWWNFYCFDGHKSDLIYGAEMEFGTPLWRLGSKNYCLLPQQKLVCRVTTEAQDRLMLLDWRQQQLTFLDAQFSAIHSLDAVNNQVVFVGASFHATDAVYQLHTEYKNLQILDKTVAEGGNQGSWRRPTLMHFTAGESRTTGWFYEPTGAHANGEKLPPLIVKVHGGPTGCAEKSLDLRIQYWCQQGFAVLDLNYRGSVGFGRHYRRALYGGWGVVDVADVEAAVAQLISGEVIHAAHCFISGSSAGGYTVLSTLGKSSLFAGGASYYGISDLARLRAQTHKFESHYLDWLIGQWPDKKDLYEQRSPLLHEYKMYAPVIFFQGAKDKIVPPNQSRLFSEKIKELGVESRYIEFADEGHGFRQSINIQNCLELERQFYGELI